MRATDDSELEKWRGPEGRQSRRQLLKGGVGKSQWQNQAERNWNSFQYKLYGRALKVNLSWTRKSRTGVMKKFLFVFISFALKTRLQALKFEFLD